METEEFNQDSFEAETENAMTESPEKKKNDHKNRKMASKKTKSSKTVIKKEPILISSDSEADEPTQNDPDYVPKPTQRRTRSSSKKQA